MTRRPLTALGVLLCGALMAQTTPPLGIRSKTPELKAFTNARLVISPTTTIDRGTLVIDRGKIVAAGANVAVPAGATVIDLSGKTVYAGFIDPYTGYGLQAAPKPESKKGDKPVYAATRIGANAWNDAIHAELDWVSYFQPDSQAAGELMRLGFTTVQSARLDGILQGRAFVTSLGDGLPNDLLLRPRSWHFASFDKGSSPQEYPTSIMGAIALIRQTLLDVDWYRQAHAAQDHNPAQKLPEFNRAIEALATLANETLVLRTGDELDLLRADRLAREFRLSLVPVGSGYEYRRAAEVKAAGRTVILPLAFPEIPEVATYGDELDITLGGLRHWDRAPSNPAVMERNGVAFAFTTHGLKDKKDFLKNLRHAIFRGLSPRKALAALTTVPAEICGIASLAGTLEPGKSADFVICDADLFVPETRILAVYTRGLPHESIPLDEVNFGGEYAASAAGATFNLSISDYYRDHRRTLRGEIKIGDRTERLEDVEAERDRLSFNAAFDTLGLAGVARFEARKVGDSLVGSLLDASGTRAAWQAVRTGAGKTDRRFDEYEQIRQDTAPTARLTSPNIAFGFESPPAAQTVLIKNATLWTSESDGILENTDLLVSGGRIAAIGRGLEAPSGARVIDAAGKHVTAGIIDEHAHICASGDINECSESVTSEVRIGDVIDPDDISVYRSLGGGVTMVRTLHGSCNSIGGQAQVLKLKWGGTAEDMKYEKAPPSIKFALGENVKQSGWGDQMTIRYPQSRMGVDNLINDAFQAAVEYERQWQRFNALGRGERERTIPPRRDLRLEPLVEVLHSRMFITCHSYVQSEILALMRLAERFGFRVTTFTHILEGYKVADEMAHHGAAAGSFADWWAYKFEVYDAIPYSPCIMNEKGVLVSMNSDSPDLERRLNQEAAKSVMYCGMSREDAWKMVTINPARQLKVDQWVGSLKVGKEADFVIWSDNPLSMYARAEQTWIDGRKYFDIADEPARRKAVLDERTAIVQKVLLRDKERRDYHDWDEQFDDSTQVSRPGEAGDKSALRKGVQR